MTGINFVGLLMCLSGIVVHIIQKIIFTKKKLNENLELHSNSITSNGTITETNVPLLNDQSTSLKNLLASNFSSDDDDGDNDDSDDKDNTSEVLFNILQRREQS